MRLDPNPTLQQQPCSKSCFPTCVAMALGEPVEKILKIFEELGIDVSARGTNDRHSIYALTHLGIGYSIIHTTPGVGLQPGTYITTSVSRNEVDSTHAVLLVVNHDGSVLTLDPQSGKEGKSWYASDEVPAALDYWYLDDFADLKDAARQAR